MHCFWKQKSIFNFLFSQIFLISVKFFLWYVCTFMYTHLDDRKSQQAMSNCFVDVMSVCRVQCYRENSPQNSSFITYVHNASSHYAPLPTCPPPFPQTFHSAVRCRVRGEGDLRPTYLQKIFQQQKIPFELNPGFWWISIQAKNILSIFCLCYYQQISDGCAQTKRWSPWDGFLFSCAVWYPKKVRFGWGGWEISDSGHFIGLSLFNVSSAIINIQRDIP